MAFTETVTRPELVNRVLKKYRVVGAGQSPRADQQQDVDDVIDSAFDELARKRVVVLDAKGAIPAGYVEHVADFVWLKCRTRFGRPAPSRADHAEIEAMIRSIDADGPTFKTMRVSFF